MFLAMDAVSGPAVPASKRNLPVQLAGLHAAPGLAERRDHRGLLGGGGESAVAGLSRLLSAVAGGGPRGALYRQEPRLQEPELVIPRQRERVGHIEKVSRPHGLRLFECVALARVNPFTLGRGDPQGREIGFMGRQASHRRATRPRGTASDEKCGHAALANNLLSGHERFPLDKSASGFNRAPMAPTKTREWTTVNKARLVRERAELGLAIRYRRLELGITQAELAKTVGVSFKSVHGVEKGHTWPSTPLFIMLAKALHAGPVPFVN